MKNLLILAIISILFCNCQSKEGVTLNRPPNAFTVTPALKNDGKTIELNWTKAVDPDGDAVTYSVFLKDTLIKNLSGTTFTISNLDFNYNEIGKVIAKDVKGMKTEANFTATTKTVIFISIPDVNFEKFLVNGKIDKDGIVNGKMNADDAKGVKSIGINTELSIKSLTGIEAFIDLETLTCVNNYGLVTFDVSKNTNLTSLACYSDKLTSLDISKNIKLQTLSCNINNLKVLDVSKNINLQKLNCSVNQLKVLDISKNINLVWLDCSENQLTTLAIGNNPKLQTLVCHTNQLATLDVSKNINLEELVCLKNPIKIICVADIAKATAKSFWYKEQTAAYSLCK